MLQISILYCIVNGGDQSNGQPAAMHTEPKKEENRCPMAIISCMHRKDPFVLNDLKICTCNQWANFFENWYKLVSTTVLHGGIIIINTAKWVTFWVTLFM